MIQTLRALRFRDLHPDDQSATVRRLRRGPPRKYWRRDAEADSVKTARRYVSALELRRIEVAGGNLPTRLRGWFLEALAEFPALEDISIEHGFTDTSVRYIRGPSPGPAVRFDHLDGEARLCALEGALSGGRLHWEDSAGSQASAWIQNPEQADQLLSDLESCVGAPEEYPHVLDCFGWFHTPPLPHHHGGPPRNASNEAERVLGLMAEMSEATLVTAIGGICHWLHAWCRHALRSESGGDLWLRAWPIAVDATNAAHESQDNDEIAEFLRSPGSDDRIADIDTLNTPSGKLVRDDSSRILRPSFLRALLARPTSGPHMLSEGIRIRGAVFDGDVDLRDVALDRVLLIVDSRFAGKVVLSRLSTPTSISFNGSH